MKLNLLCVDDSKSVHTYLKSCLSDSGMVVESVYDGAQAVDIIKEGNFKFDVILLDWEMPIKNGPETFEELKKMGNQIPVIMLTSKNSAENINQMITAGVSEYIMKPFTKEIILEKIKLTLEGSNVNV